MEFRYAARVTKLGKATMGITIPKKSCQLANIKAGDVLQVTIVVEKNWPAIEQQASVSVPQIS